MARTPYFDKHGNKKGAWSKEEDNMLIAYIARYGHWNWSEIPKFAGVSRCGKSCRLRWMNYLRPNMKRGNITKEEEDSIIKLHGKFGNKWSTIAAKLPGRSDNEIKNYWNTNLRKRAKQDQLCHKTAESYNNLAKSKQNLIKNQNIEDKTSSSEWSSVNTHSRSFANPSASTARMESLSSSLSDFDGSVTCNFTPRLNFENAGSFWTDPFLADVDSAPMNEYPSCLDLGQASSNDMITDDEFIWSSMNLYDGYHKQLKQ